MKEAVYYQTIGGAIKSTEKPAAVNPMVKAYGLGPEGSRCKTCLNFQIKQYSKRYFKCRYRGDSAGPGTDHRANWPACSKYLKIN